MEKLQFLLILNRSLELLEFVWDPLRDRAVWTNALGPPHAALETSSS